MRFRLQHIRLFFQTFFYDPEKPEIREMATMSDFEDVYAKFTPGERVTYVAGELQALTGQYATLCVSAGEYATTANCSVATMMASHSACQRIIAEPVPFVYAHLLSVLLFLYVFLNPFQLLLSGGLCGFGLLAVMILCFGYYGVNEASIRMSNPFGWDPVDHDVGSFGVAISSNSAAIAAGSGN